MRRDDIEEITACVTTRRRVTATTHHAGSRSTEKRVGLAPRRSPRRRRTAATRSTRTSPRRAASACSGRASGGRRCDARERPIRRSFHSIPLPFHCHSIAIPLPFHSIPLPSHSIPFHPIPSHSIPFHSRSIPVPFPFHSHSIPIPLPREGEAHQAVVRREQGREDRKVRGRACGLCSGTHRRAVSLMVKKKTMPRHNDVISTVNRAECMEWRRERARVRLHVLLTTTSNCPPRRVCGMARGGEASPEYGCTFTPHTA